jgi:hypothetical protein
MAVEQTGFGEHQAAVLDAADLAARRLSQRNTFGSRTTACGSKLASRNSVWQPPPAARSPSTAMVAPLLARTGAPSTDSSDHW